MRTSSSSHSCQPIISDPFDTGHSHRCEVASQWHIDFCVHENQWQWGHHGPLGHLHVVLGESICLALLRHFHGVVCSVVLKFFIGRSWIVALCQMCDVQIICYSGGFFLVIAPFAVKIEVPWIPVDFARFLCWWSQIPEDNIETNIGIFGLCSLLYFMVLKLPSKPLIHSEWTLVPRLRVNKPVWLSLQSQHHLVSGKMFPSSLLLLFWLHTLSDGSNKEWDPLNPLKIDTLQLINTLLYIHGKWNENSMTQRSRVEGNATLRTQEVI